MPVEEVKRFGTKALQWWQRQRLARALARYSAGKGGQLSGGIALTGLLSVAAALTIGLTAMVGVFRRHPVLRDEVFDQIDLYLPGVIDTGDGGMISPESFVQSGGWSIAAIVGAVVLLNTAITVMQTMRISLQSMFGLHSATENFIFGKLRDLVAFIVLASSLVATALLSIAGRAAFDWIQTNLGHLGIVPNTQAALQILTILTALVVDAGVFILLFRWLAGARVPWPEMWKGALLGAVGTGTLRILGASVVTNVGKYPLLASAAAVATLLLWLNIAARLTLIVAAWTANPPAIPQVAKDRLQHADHTPNYVSVSAPETLEWNYGAYTGLVQPLPPDEDDGTYDATLAAAEAHLRRKEAGNPIRRLRDYFDSRNEPDPDVHSSPVLEPQASEKPAGPPPLVRIAPDSPLGRLRAKFAERRGEG